MYIVLRCIAVLANWLSFGICGLLVSGVYFQEVMSGSLCAGSDIGGQRAGSDVGGLVSGSDDTGIFVQEVMSGVCCWGSSFRK